MKLVDWAFSSRSFQALEYFCNDVRCDLTWPAKLGVHCIEISHQCFVLRL